MEVYVLKSWIMTNECTFKRLKSRLRHAKFKVTNIKDSDLKDQTNTSSETNNFKYSKFLPRDRKSVYLIYQKQRHTENLSRIVEVKTNTGVFNIWLNQYDAEMLNYNKGIMHGYSYSYSDSTFRHAACTRTTFTTFELPGRYVYNSQTDTCMIYETSSLSIYLVVQLDLMTLDNIDDMKQLPYTIYDVRADNECFNGFCEYTFIPVEKCRAIVDYIYVIAAVDDKDDQYGYPIQITNKKANRYRHHANKQTYDQHFVLVFDKFVLLSVNSLADNPDENDEAGIYILNDSLEVISRHTEYVTHEIINMHKLHIGNLIAFMIECSIELRFMAYDGKRLFNIRNFDTSMFNGYWQTKVIDYGLGTEIMWIVNNDG